MSKSHGHRFPVLNWLDLSHHSRRSLSGDALDDLMPHDASPGKHEVILSGNLQYFPVDRPKLKPVSEGAYLSTRMLLEFLFTIV